MATRSSTRTRLLDAAESLLFTRGVAATSVDAVLERAGVSPATLYRAYAGGKDELVAAALERRLQDWVTVWEAAVDRAPDDRRRLLAVFDALADFQARPEGARWCAFLGTAAEYAEPPPVLAAAIAQDSETLRRRLGELARPVVGRRAPALAEALTLVVSGQLAMRLRPTARTGALVAARAVAETLVEHPERLR